MGEMVWQPLNCVVALQYWKLGTGGAERATLELATMLVHEGCRVVLLTNVPPREGELPVLSDISHHTISTQDEGSRLQELEEVLRSESVEYLIYNSWLSEWAATDLRAAHELGIRTCYCPHGSAVFFMDKPDLGPVLLERMTSCATQADAIACLSQVDALFWEALNSNVHVVSNSLAYLKGVVPPKPSEATQELVWCGRLDPMEKRPLLALEVFSLVHQRLPLAHLTMVGGGTDEVMDELTTYIQNQDLEDVVTLVGEQPEPLAYIASADVCMITSPTEGFCFGLAEAMALGVPSVLFELPNLSLLENNKGAVQIPWGNQDEFAQQLCCILENAELRQRLSTAARSAFDRAAEVDIAQIWRGILESLACANTTTPTANPSNALVRSVVGAYDRLIVSSQAERNALSAERDGLIREVTSLKDELYCTRESLSFRLGRAATFIPRKLRGLLSGQA